MKLNITVDGQTYEVDVEASEPEPTRPSYTASAAAPRAAAPSAAASAPRSAGPTVADESKASRSPVTGMVVRVDVQSGQDVKAGDVIMVLEAMKMETNITAPVAGTVAAVHVAVGDAVKKNQALAEFA